MNILKILKIASLITFIFQVCLILFSVYRISCGYSIQLNVTLIIFNILFSLINVYTVTRED